jgi:hypothetical protein
MRSSAWLVLAGLAVTGAAGCQPDTVRISFDPKPGATYAFDVTTDAHTTTSLPGVAPDATHDSTTLHASQTVLSTDATGVRVEVRLRIADVGEQTYVVQLDRAAQLTRVESVEGIPSAALGEFGLTEIFPAAAGAPPPRGLHPGDTWTIDDRVQLAGTDTPTRLRGTGTLVELGVIAGHKTATVRSHFELPVSQTATTASGQSQIDGTQVSELTITYDLADGAVRRAEATTTGRFTLTLSPPAGANARPIKGSLAVEVHSKTQRA